MINLTSGCAKHVRQERQAALDIRAYYVKVGSITINANIIADYGGRTYDYDLTYVGDGLRGTVIVKAPAIVEGLTAIVDDGAVQLSTGGTVIDTGGIAGKGTNPLESFPLIVNAWRSGYVTSAYAEKFAKDSETPSVQCIAIEYRLGDGGVTLKTWFNYETFTPVRSEIYDNGYCVILADYYE
jgi:hypothetical protein